MERNAIILVVLLALPLAACAESSGWFNQWYRQWSQGEERFEQREQQVQRVEKTRCELKIEKYQGKVEEYPDSDYYSWKLRTWEKKCADDE